MAVNEPIDARVRLAISQWPEDAPRGGLYGLPVIASTPSPDMMDEPADYSALRRVERDPVVGQALGHTMIGDGLVEHGHRPSFEAEVPPPRTLALPPMP